MDWTNALQNQLTDANGGLNKLRNDAYKEIAWQIYWAWKDELKKSDSPYDISTPMKNKDGVWVVRPSDPAKAFQVEFGKFADSTSLTEDHPDQIMRRVVSKASRFLQRYKAAGLIVDIKYVLRNPTQ